MKGSHPVEVDELAKARGIADEPAFVWWLPYTLRKQEAILSAVKSRIRKATHKYGIQIPTSLEHAYAIDKETHYVGMVFEILPYGKTAPVEWKVSYQEKVHE